MVFGTRVPGTSGIWYLLSYCCLELLIFSVSGIWCYCYLVLLVFGVVGVYWVLLVLGVTGI